jgi:hypothetical protein
MTLIKFRGRRTRPIWAVVLILGASAIGGCSSAHNDPGAAVTPPRPTAASTSPVAPPAPALSLPDTAPASGTTLLTVNPEANGSNGTVQVVTDGHGFSVLDGISVTGPSTITTYNAAGAQLAVISRGYTSLCGAADVLVPGTGRLIITELISRQAAQGINPATYSLQLTAWNATTGAAAWTADVIPSGTASLSCITGGGLGYLDGGPDLLNFGVTSDGRWGVYASGLHPPAVVDLNSGAIRADPDSQGALGPYLVEACQPADSLGVLNILKDPQSGVVYGKSMVQGDAYHPNGPCRTGADDGAVQNLGHYGPNGLELAPAGLFFTDSNGTSPGSGLASAGNGLLVDRTVNGNTPTPEIMRYSLPDLQPMWQKIGSFYMWGDGDGITVVTKSGPEDTSQTLAGLNDETGAPEWSIPGGSGNVCAVTSSQFIYAVNDQLAVLSIKTGKQISYSANPNDGDECPVLLPSGLSVQASYSSVTVTQAIQP